MKEGWSKSKIGDICSITDFVSNGSFASLRENVKYYNSPNYAVLVRLADASNGFDKSKFIYTDEHGYDFSEKSHLHGGELIMSNVGSVGSMFICPEMSQPMTLAPNTISITSQNNKFLYYYFFSDGFKKKLKGITSSTTLKKFNKTNFKSLEILIPTLSEQQRIVEYLDAAFAKIEATKANAEKSLNEAKALFQASLKEMLEPKEGWEEKKLGDIAEIKGGKRLPKGEKLLSEPTGHKYIRVTDFNEYGTVDLGNIQYISDEVYEQIKRYIINKEDIYISIAGTIGKSGIIPEELDGANLTENACRLILSKEINQRFMYYATISPDFIRQETESTKISAQPKLALTRLADIIIAYPPIVEQQSIVATLDSLKSKVDRLQENYDKISQECDALKQAILRQVFE